MAKVKLINTREHAIHLNLPGRTETIVVPGTRQNAEDRDLLIHGSVLVEDSFVDQCKKHPVVQHYFKEGWLRQQEKAKPEPAKPTDPAA